MERCGECFQQMKEKKISIRRNFYRTDVIVHGVPSFVCSCGEYRIKSTCVENFINLAKKTYEKSEKNDYVVEVEFQITK